MNKELFIARRITKGGDGTGRLSKPIVLISVWGITIGMVVMILAVAIVTGFQSEIRDKVIGFGSHIQITSMSGTNSFQSTPVPVFQEFYPHLDTVTGVDNIQIYATKPGIIQANGEIQGFIAKGVSSDFNWGFFDGKMKEGKMLQFGEETNDSIMISQYLTNKLRLKLHDTLVTVFFPETGNPQSREFIVAGIYETGLEDFDHQVIVTDIRHLQRLNKWGVRAFLRLEPDCENGKIAVEASAIGAYQHFEYNWGDPTWREKGPHYICPTQDTTIQVIVTDIQNWGDLEQTIPDTAWLKLTFDSAATADNPCRCGEANYTFEQWTTGGSDKYYVGGFEVLLDDYDELQNMDDHVRYLAGYGLTTATILEQFPEIFAWLEMIDINVYVLIGLMIAVSVINMISALLILILEKTNMIGVLKAIGSTNWSVRKIFLYNASYLIGKGMIRGNLIAIALCLLQHYFKLVKLPQENYYISEVPINLQFDHLIWLNLGTIVICMLVLIVPSYLITKITPVKAIRFN